MRPVVLAMERFEAFKCSTAFWQEWVINDLFQRTANKKYDASTCETSLSRVSELEVILSTLEYELQVLKGMRQGRRVIP